MFDDVDERIEHRTVIADGRLETQSPFKRVMNRVGLFTANASDRASSLNSNTTSFAAGAVYGALEGIVNATWLWVALVCLSVLTPITAPTAFFLLAGAGAVGFGLYEGQKAADRHRQKANGRHLSDTIAEKTGAMPTREIERTSSVAAQEIEDRKASYAAREDARRERMEAEASSHHGRHH